MKKRFALALMASTLLLAGCGAARTGSADDEFSSLAQAIESPDSSEEETKVEADEVSGNVSDFISKHGYINARETEADELNNTHWVSFENYNIETYEYSDYETSDVFENITLKMGENGEGVIYFGEDMSVNFTYTLSEYPVSAEGKTETGEDFFMYFQTFNFDGSDMEIIDLEIGSWVYYLWPVG